MLILSDIPRHTTHSVDYLTLITVNPDYKESAPYIFLVIPDHPWLLVPFSKLTAFVPGGGGHQEDI